MFRRIEIFMLVAALLFSGCSSMVETTDLAVSSESTGKGIQEASCYTESQVCSNTGVVAIVETVTPCINEADSTEERKQEPDGEKENLQFSEEMKKDSAEKCGEQAQEVFSERQRKAEPSKLTEALPSGATTVSPMEAPKPTEVPKPTEAPKPIDPKPTEPRFTQPSPAQPIHTHSYTPKAVSPTCTEKGYTEHACSCGDSFKDSYTDALGHSFSEQSIVASCTSGGYSLWICTRCEATETSNTTPALGHDYHDTVVAPTTSTQGYTEHICSRCGDSYRDSYTEKLSVIYDIYQAMEAGNSYARGRGCEIDATMTTGNSSYYPANEMTGSMLAAHGGQSDLNGFAVSKVESTINHLVALDGTEELLPYTRIRCYVEYHESTDSYEIWVLYG